MWKGCVGVEVELLVVRALSHYLLLPWSGRLSDADQQWDERSARFTVLLQRTLHDYIVLSHQLIRLDQHHHHQQQQQQQQQSTQSQQPKQTANLLNSGESDYAAF